MSRWATEYQERSFNRLLHSAAKRQATRRLRKAGHELSTRKTSDLEKVWQATTSTALFGRLRRMRWSMRPLIRWQPLTTQVRHVVMDLGFKSDPNMHRAQKWPL
jgi:hypothetical protein